MLNLKFFFLLIFFIKFQINKSGLIKASEGYFIRKIKVQFCVKKFYSGQHFETKQSVVIWNKYELLFPNQFDKTNSYVLID